MPQKSDSTSGGAASSSDGASGGASQTAAQGEEDWLLRLVNHTHPLPEGFTVETSTLPNGLEFDSRAIGQLEQMLADGNAAGLQLMVCSAYRSVARQDELFNEMMQDYIAEGYSEEEAYDITATIRTPHGCSEHSTGLAADIVAVDYQMLDDGYAETDEAKWLLKTPPTTALSCGTPRTRSRSPASSGSPGTTGMSGWKTRKRSRRAVCVWRSTSSPKTPDGMRAKTVRPHTPPIRPPRQRKRKRKRQRQRKRLRQREKREKNRSKGVRLLCPC